MSNKPTIKYRSDIDGLRALAVLSVLFYHLHIDGFFIGGFLGVDVFFVISGYLISALILKEYRTTQDFSFKGFYNRRVRRLLPVLLSVIIASFIAAWYILLPSQLIDFSKSIIASIFFYSNYY